MTRLALISDIHSNIEALTSVFDDIDARGIDDVVCLGDVVGYGPDPEVCVDLVIKRCRVTIRGNHDDALFGRADHFNPYARSAIEWTRDRLKPGFLKPRANAVRWKFLEELPLEHREGDLYFVHGSPRDHVNEYVYREDVFFNAEGKLKEIFARVDRVLFVGHTHLPTVIGDNLKTFVPTDKTSTFELSEAGKFIVNVGSVGQPRDRDPRACYVEIDGDAVHYHRVEYDIEAVRRKIARIGSLDPILGHRLLEGM